MARQVRIEFEGAFYHVMCRGDRREAIFWRGDRREFLHTLAQTGWQVHTCLLPIPLTPIPTPRPSTLTPLNASLNFFLLQDY